MTVHQWLSAELAQRKASNPRYSLRLLAKRLGISPGRLSEYISGKRPITSEQADKIADRLGLNLQRRTEFLTLANRRIEKQFDTAEPTSHSDAKFRQLSADAFNVVADWYHFAILSLMDLDDFEMNAAWIGARLGIPKSTAQGALKRLKNLGLIEKVSGIWQKRESQHMTTHDVPSAALKISHRQTLQQAIEALDEVPIELRDITSITMAVNPKTIPEVKRLIKSFRRKVASVMEASEKTEVYNLNIQLVPVTRIQKKVGYEN